MPKLDFKKITLGHGGGGLLTHRLLNSGVFNLLSNDWLDEQHDGAFLQFNGEVAFSTDSFVVTPLFFPGGNIGDLAVNGTVNDVAMCGAMPRYISLSFILEEGLPMEDLWEIMVTIKEACKEAGVAVVTGDTKVVEKGKGDGIFINTTGLGPVSPNARIGIKHIKEGDKVVVSGPIATHGVVILSCREGLEFNTSLQSDTQPLHRAIAGILDRFGHDIHFLRDPTRGGVASTLNEIASFSNLGIQLDESALPFENQVKGACEMLGLDPLYVANEGIFISIVDDSIAENVVQLLRTDLGCPRATIIGEVSSDVGKSVVLKSPLGGRRIVQMLPGDQLPRIC